MNDQNPSITGDINQDGKVDETDLRQLEILLKEMDAADLKRHLSDEEIQRLDINRDGELTYDDVFALARIIHQALSEKEDAHARSMAGRFEAFLHSLGKRSRML